MGFLGNLFKGEGAPEPGKPNPEDKLRERLATIVNKERSKHGLGPVDAKDIPGVSGGEEEKRRELVADGLESMLEGLGKILSGEIPIHSNEGGKVFIEGMITYGKALAMKYAHWMSDYGEEIGFGVSVAGYAWHGIEAKKHRAELAKGSKRDAELAFDAEPKKTESTADEKTAGKARRK